jgi:trans-2,3-dihydro-3-hydroxyanthranilate isomerase
LLFLPSADQQRPRRGADVRPSIGVPEDIANANSAACLAVHLADSGHGEITVDMGDALHRPATIMASVSPVLTGQRVPVGGAAKISRIDD